MLYHSRNKLREYLKKEGIEVWERPESLMRWIILMMILCPGQLNIGEFPVTRLFRKTLLKACACFLVLALVLELSLRGENGNVVTFRLF